MKYNVRIELLSTEINNRMVALFSINLNSNSRNYLKCCYTFNLYICHNNNNNDNHKNNNNKDIIFIIDWVFFARFYLFCVVLKFDFIFCIYGWCEEIVKTKVSCKKTTHNKKAQFIIHITHVCQFELKTGYGFSLPLCVQYIHFMLKLLLLLLWWLVSFHGVRTAFETGIISSRRAWWTMKKAWPSLSSLLLISFYSCIFCCPF